MTFSAIQKLKLFSLLKIKEGLKQVTEIELPVLMRVLKIKNICEGAVRKVKLL